MLPIKLVALPIVLMLAVGCDSKKDTSPKKDAASKAASEQAETDKRIAARKEKRLAEEKAKKDEEAAVVAKVEALCVLPEALPKNLEKGCEAVSAAHDGFMLRNFADNAATIEKWNAGKTMQLGMTSAQCTKAGSIEVAACQANALSKAPVELKKQLPAFLRTCIDKFGTPAAGDTPAAPKPK